MGHLQLLWETSILLSKTHPCVAGADCLLWLVSPNVFCAENGDKRHSEKEWEKREMGQSVVTFLLYGAVFSLGDAHPPLH